MRAAGFTDNGGAIHSAERILNILGLCLVYPDLSHINNLRKYAKAEFSVKALAAYDRGERSSSNTYHRFEISHEGYYGDVMP